MATACVPAYRVETGLLCGNSKLKPEESTSYEVSLHFDNERPER